MKYTKPVLIISILCSFSRLIIKILVDFQYRNEEAQLSGCVNGVTTSHTRHKLNPHPYCQNECWTFHQVLHTLAASIHESPVVKVDAKEAPSQSFTSTAAAAALCYTAILYNYFLPSSSLSQHRHVFKRKLISQTTPWWQR